MAWREKELAKFQVRETTGDVDQKQASRARAFGLRVAQEVTKLRQRRGWSRAKLAHESYLQEAMIDLIEAGDHDMHLSTLIQVADALGVAPFVLLHGNWD